MRTRLDKTGIKGNRPEELETVCENFNFQFDRCEPVLGDVEVLPTVNPPTSVFGGSRSGLEKFKRGTLDHFNRIQHRSMEDPPIKRDVLHMWFEMFQAPTSEEMELFDKPLIKTPVCDPN